MQVVAAWSSSILVGPASLTLKTIVHLDQLDVLLAENVKIVVSSVLQNGAVDL